jgi:hypothetical protein
MTEAEAFVENWSRVWRGPDSDPQLYMELLHYEGAVAAYRSRSRTERPFVTV